MAGASETRHGLVDETQYELVPSAETAACRGDGVLLGMRVSRDAGLLRHHCQPGASTDLPGAFRGGLTTGLQPEDARRCVDGVAHGQGSQGELSEPRRYCIQPPGDGPSRHATMDCLAADTMPIFFDQHLTAVMPFSDIVDFAEFTESAPPRPAAHVLSWTGFLLHRKNEDEDEGASTPGRHKEVQFGLHFLVLSWVVLPWGVALVLSD